MARKDKDRPLLLRRRSDGTLHLNADSFPPRHEFSKDWLLENTADGTVTLSPEQITLQLANGRAVYRIDRERTEAEHSTGYWGVLEKGEVS